VNQREFEAEFDRLTGNKPLSWQARLWKDHFTNNHLPKIIDLPTGLGKTMVMAIWLIARMQPDSKLPRRLIYVVDRRTVVDQATDTASQFAYLLSPLDEHDARKRYQPRRDLIDRKSAHAEALQDLRRKLTPDDTGLAISTLRGQLADNREWSRDPSKPAIIIGTVDLIGSALLFSGYRSSYKRRPLEAGLLGQDSLLVLDEAHLSKPFEKLLKSIEPFNQPRGTGVLPVKPLRVIRMSATTAGDDTNRFKLEASDLVPEVLNRDGIKVRNPIVERFESPKKLYVTTLGEKDKLNEKLADAAIALANRGDLVGKRIVVFVRGPDDARAIAESIRKREATKTKPGIYGESVEILTGTMRGLERDELVQKTVFTDRWLNGSIDPSDASNKVPVFLISTSAGEVGFDLNADHMVCDAAPIDSMIQRLGRVNRRGKGDAIIQLLVETPKKNEKEDKPKKLEGFELSIANTIDLLRASMNGADSLDVSPKNIAHFKQTAWKEIPEDELKKDKPKTLYELACSPEPTMVDLTDILLDAWSMTSITEPMPGRPEVGPWLRGIDDEQAKTTIAWRAELDLPWFDQLDLKTIEEWFDTHRVLTYETLSVPPHVAAKWFNERWNNLSEFQKGDIGPRSLVVDRAGLKLVAVNDLIDQLSRKSGDTTSSIRNADLILPASFGGIERGKGMLEAASPEAPKDEDKKPADEQSKAREARAVAADVADARFRYREVVTKTEDSDAERKPLAAGIKPAKSARYTLTLESDDDKTVKLVSYVPKFEKPESGEKRQSLEGHVIDVRKRADAIISALKLPENDPMRIALELAADWHDHGKNREFFQRTVDGRRSDGQRPWPKHVRGKSGGKDFGKAPRGYRHEFGSLREFIDAHKEAKFTDSTGKNITKEVIDLAMHLIATHHARGRPHFPKGGFDPDAENRSDGIHTDSIRRFARLQRDYGHWHLAWLENLLRCADAMASADPETDTDDAEGADQ
jgi:CRISPR-associated endonuclease/helicase Cas3